MPVQLPPPQLVPTTAAYRSGADLLQLFTSIEMTPGLEGLQFRDDEKAAKDFKEQGKKIVDLIKKTLGDDTSKTYNVPGSLIVEPEKKNSKNATTEVPVLGDCTLTISQTKFADGRTMIRMVVDEKGDTGLLQNLDLAFNTEGDKFETSIDAPVPAPIRVIGQKFMRAFLNLKGLDKIRGFLEKALKKLD